MALRKMADLFSCQRRERDRLGLANSEVRSTFLLQEQLNLHKWIRLLGISLAQPVSSLNSSHPQGPQEKKSCAFSSYINDEEQDKEPQRFQKHD